MSRIFWDLISTFSRATFNDFPPELHSEVPSGLFQGSLHRFLPRVHNWMVIFIPGLLWNFFLRFLRGIFAVFFSRLFKGVLHWLLPRLFYGFRLTIFSGFHSLMLSKFSFSFSWDFFGKFFINLSRILPGFFSRVLLSISSRISLGTFTDYSWDCIRDSSKILAGFSPGFFFSLISSTFSPEISPRDLFSDAFE